MKGGLIHVWIWWWATVAVMVMAVGSVAVCFDYSIVYLVNYHWCSYLELKKALKKGPFFVGDGFALFIVLFILLIIAGVTYWYYI